MALDSGQSGGLKAALNVAGKIEMRPRIRLALVKKAGIVQVAFNKRSFELWPDLMGSLVNGRANCLENALPASH